MSKYVIALNKDVDFLDGEQYSTIEEAKSAATEILKQLNSGTSKSIDDFEDKVCGYLDDGDEIIDNLTILEINSAGFPDFGYMIFDGLEDYCVSEGNLDEDYPEGVTNEELVELNELVTKWLTDKEGIHLVGIMQNLYV